MDTGHVVQEDHDASSNAEDKAIRNPIESDFLYHFSTSPGKVYSKLENCYLIIRRSKTLTTERRSMVAVDLE